MVMFEEDNNSGLAAICHRVLRRYAPRIAPVRIEYLGNRGGFSGAAIWRVATEQGDFALRRWPRSQLPPARIVGLHRLLAHLHREGLSFVSVPVATSVGATLLHEVGDDWQLEPWLPGVADFHAFPTEERLRACMAALAQWHRSAERFEPDATAAPWFHSRMNAASPAVGERLQILNRINEELLCQIEKSVNAVLNPQIRELTCHLLNSIRHRKQIIANELRSVCEVRIRLHPCLRDVWHDHLLFAGDQLTGLIDPSASRTENVACDLSRLIGSLVGNNRIQWELALNTYQMHRPLSNGELRLIEVLDRSGVVLSGWVWLEWIYLQQRTFADPIPVIKRLRSILDRMPKSV